MGSSVSERVSGSSVSERVSGSQEDLRADIKALPDDVIALGKKVTGQGVIGQLHAEVLELEEQIADLNSSILSDSKEIELTKPYNTATFCKGVKSLTDQAADFRAELDTYKIKDNLPATHVTGLRDRFSARRTAQYDLMTGRSSLELDVYEASALSELYMRPMYKAFLGLGVEVMNFGTTSTKPQPTT